GGCLAVNLLVKFDRRFGRPVLLHPRVTSIAHDREQPRPHIPALVAVEKSKGAQKSFLRHVLRVVIVSRQPAGKVVRRVQMRQDGLLKAFACCCAWHSCVSRVSLPVAQASARGVWSGHHHALPSPKSTGWSLRHS